MWWIFKRNYKERVDLLELALDQIIEQNRNERIIMSAQLDALKAAIATIGPKVDQLLALAQAPRADDSADLQAAADALNGIVPKIDQAIAALTQPAATPAAT